MLALALGMWLAASVAADPVRILVVDGRTGGALPGVHVQVLSAAGRGDVVAERQTDAEGLAQFDGLPPGAYTLTISTLGYGFVRRALTVPAAGPVTMTIALSEGSGAYREAVTVAAAPAAAETGVSSQMSLGAAAITDLRGSATDDAMRAIQALPGVVTGDDFQAEFSMRGSAFRHAGIVIDDTPAPLLMHAVRGRDDAGSLAMVNADVLERVTLLAGPHPQRHGAWLGPTVDFQMRAGSRDRTRLRGAVSGTSASIVLEGPVDRSRRGAWLLTARRSYVDWLVRKLDPEISSTIGFTDAQAKVTWDLSTGHAVEVLALGGEAVYREPDAGQVNGLARAVSTGGLVSAGWRWLHPRVTTRHRVSVTGSRLTNTGQVSQVLAQSTTTTLAWRTDASIAAGPHAIVEAGAQVERTSGDFSAARYARSGPGQVRLTARREATGRRTTRAAWGQISRRSPRWAAVGGVRLVQGENDQSAWVAPWLLVEVRAGAATWKAGAGATRQPASLEAALSSSLVTGPERARGLDAGVSLAPSARFRVDLTGFVRRERDVIRTLGEEQLRDGVRIAQSLFPIAATRLSGTSRGVDVLVQRLTPPGAAGLSGWVAYTWAHTRHTDAVTGEQFDADFDQRHTVNGFVQYRFSYRSAVNARVRIGSNTPLIGYFAGTAAAPRLGAARNQVRLPPYARVDLRAQRAVRLGERRLTLFVEVVNALGRRNLGQADGFFTDTLEGRFFTERLIPRVPSVGAVIEF